MLLSDFGRDDIFVAEVELEFRKRIGHGQIIHVTHSIRPHDVSHAAILLASWINAGQRPVDLTVCLVDPDTTRPIVVATCNGHRIVAPDNGCLTLVEDQLERIDSWVDPSASEGEQHTFRGRSVLPGIVAQVLDHPATLAPNSAAKSVERIHDAEPVRQGHSKLSGRLLHVDHFGNVMTNVPNAWADESVWIAQVGALRIDRWIHAYHQATNGELMLVRGSSGFVEISVQCGRAADFRELEIGRPIELFRTITDSKKR